jgi:hypothetical protein
MLTEREQLTAGTYYALHDRTGADVVIHLTGDSPCLDLLCARFPAAKLGDFRKFQRVPSRKQWSDAVELRDSIREGHGELTAA